MLYREAFAPVLMLATVPGAFAAAAVLRAAVSVLYRHRAAVGLVVSIDGIRGAVPGG